MAWFSQETEQERQQRELAQQLQEQQAKQARAAEEFARTPRGRAQIAARENLRWLRIELPMWQVNRSRGFLFGVDESQDEITSPTAYAYTISEVEAEGWQLFSTASAFVIDAIETSSNGGQEAVSGHLVDVLTFRRLGNSA